MSITVSMGNKKRTFKSIKLFADAVGISYMTAYMRLRAADKDGGLGWKPITAASKPVRKYVKKMQEA